jgi:uncharacterized protein (TIGR03067 family)
MEMQALLALALSLWSFSGLGDAVAAELKPFDGAWRVTVIETDGQRIELAPEDGRLTIRGGRLTADGSVFTLRVDTTTDPKLMDLTQLEGPDAGKILEAIYRLEGNTLTLCVFTGGGVKVRPAEFTARAGSGCALFTLLRQPD